MPISHSVELVDAATALQWLEHNKRNRPVSNATVARYGTSVEIITGRNHNSIRVGGLNPDQYPEHHADDTLATLRIKSTPNGTNVALVAHFGDTHTLHDVARDMVQFLFAHTPGATLRSVTA